MIRPSELFRAETLDIRLAAASNTPLATAKPSRWNTSEYYLYYLAFLTIPILMFKSVYDVSQPSHPTYKHYAHLLSPGWIPGRQVDNSDAQYSNFRDNIPYMALLLILHPLLRAGANLFTSSQPSSQSKKASAEQADARLRSRVNFDLVFTAIFMIALHGVSALKIFLILYVNYHVAMSLPRKYVGIATWVFNMGVLFSNELCHGYRFADLSVLLSSTPINANASLGAKLDSYGGLIPRWEIFFKITVLRLISYNFDYIWMLDRGTSNAIEVFRF
jgi:hypothetical protein